ncbi:cytochrome P450 [Streptomyces sp. NPDC048665]|uniref:cytochrome P450 n=1 Tax=Streptomyces sp. NPDC048665 TaxID=3155490 RepID=UPI0034144AF3
MRTVPFLDVTDPEFDFRGPEVAAAQAGDWWAESPVGLVVLRYAEAQELLRDPRLTQSGEAYLAMNGVLDGPLYDWYLRMIINQDGENHRRLRGLVGKAFTLRMINNLRPGVRAAAERLADRLAAAGACDFVAEYADRLVLAVLSELLGVPAQDHEIFRRWSTDIGLVFSLAHGGDIRARVETAVSELNAYVDGLMADKRANPGSDLVSALVATEPDDEHLSVAELRNFIVALVFAAHDATLRQLAHAMVAFAGHPEQWTVLAQRPRLTDKAIEEVMRWSPTTTTVHRFATTDFDFRSVRLTAGTVVTVAVVPAQRDPAVFRDGHLFDITAPREAPLLQFGAGPHHCLGAVLARAELGEALRALTARFGPPVVTDRIIWRPPMGITGPAVLPLRFDPRR